MINFMNVNKRTKRNINEDMDEDFFLDGLTCNVNGIANFISDYTPRRENYYGDDNPNDNAEDDKVFVSIGDLVRGTAVKDGKAYTGYVTRFLWDEDGVGIAGLLIRTEDTSELVEIYV
jgi:hypothetical protein|nr:MAG TPA: hypothetical protein [Caudoviricetes sp.]